MLSQYALKTIMANSKSKKTITTHSSAAEYLTFVSATGEGEESIEIRYEEENIWMTQKMMAELYGVSVSTINQHLDRLIKDDEIDSATIKNYLTVQKEGSRTQEEIDYAESKGKFVKYS